MEKRIVKFLQINNIVSRKDTEIYLYGIRQLLRLLCNLSTTIIVGAVMGLLLESICFSLSFIPVRQFAGGYHAKSPRICYVFSTILIVLALIAINYMRINELILFIIVFLASYIIFRYAPAESKVNKLLDKDKIRFRKYVRIILSINNVLAISLYFLGIELITKCILMAMIMESVLLILSVKQRKETYEV